MNNFNEFQTKVRDFIVSHFYQNLMKKIYWTNMDLTVIYVAITILIIIYFITNSCFMIKLNNVWACQKQESDCFKIPKGSIFIILYIIWTIIIIFFFFFTRCFKWFIVIFFVLLMFLDDLFYYLYCFCNCFFVIYVTVNSSELMYFH